jgi:hypothetical protein
MNRSAAIWASLLGFVAVGGVLIAIALTPLFMRTVEKGSAAYAVGDYAKAISVLQPLADDGEPAAQFYIGEMYRFGRGFKKDEIRSAIWYKKAAMKGSPEAQYTLGMMYATGIGVNKDFVEAYRWLSLANFRLSPWETERRDKAVWTRDQILNVMPQDDVERAKALVVAWDRKWKK